MNSYEVLGVNESMDEKAIKRAYFAAIKINSPEKNPEEFKRLNQAYEAIKRGDGKNNVIALEAQQFCSKAKEYLMNSMHCDDEHTDELRQMALSCYLTALKYEPNDPDIVCSIAKCYAFMQKAGLMEKHCRKYLDILPDSTELQNYYASACIMRGWYKKAVPFIEKLLSASIIDINLCNTIIIYNEYSDDYDRFTALLAKTSGPFANIIKVTGIIDRYRKKNITPWKDINLEKELSPVFSGMSGLEASDFLSAFNTIFMNDYERLIFISDILLKQFKSSADYTRLLNIRLSVELQQYRLEIDSTADSTDFASEVQYLIYDLAYKAYMRNTRDVSKLSVMEAAQSDFDLFDAYLQLILTCQNRKFGLYTDKKKYKYVSQSIDSYIEQLRSSTNANKLAEKVIINALRGASPQFVELIRQDVGDDNQLELMQQIANAPQTVRSAKKIPPNSPCPCGSGKKYKKCCGRNQTV